MLQTLVGSAISQWLRSALLLLGSLAMLLVTSPKLAGIVLLVVPLVVLPAVLFGRRERRLSRLAQDRVADLGAYAEETFNALRTVQAFTHEPVDRALFDGQLDRSVAAAVARIRTRATLIGVVILLGFGAIVFSLWIGGRDVIAGRLSGGDLSAFVFYAVLLASSGAQMSELWGEMQRAAGAADRLHDLLRDDAPPAPARPPPMSVRLPAHPPGRVSLDAVTFRYPARPDHAALASLSLDVAAGETVALVGPSGAGKTTVLQLLLRFYDPDAGAIRLDGVDLRDLDVAELRRHVGIVPQDPVIFGTTALENIRYGRPEAGDAAVRAAARAAHADFLGELPQGYDTPAGREGHPPVRRPAPARGDRARDPARPRGAAARRGHQRARRGVRAGGAGGAGHGVARPHHDRGGAPAGDGAPRRPHRGDGGRPHRRHRHPRDADRRERPLCPPGPAAVPAWGGAVMSPIHG